MSRRKGSKNKSKFILVTIDEIVSKFNSGATIRIDASYSSLFDPQPSQTVVVVPPLKETAAGKEVDNIEMSVS